MRLRLGASGAEKLCALGATGRFWAAPQLHRSPSNNRWRGSVNGKWRSIGACGRPLNFTVRSRCGTA